MKPISFSFPTRSVWPQTISLLQTRAEPLDIELVIGITKLLNLHPKRFGAIVPISCDKLEK